jgi:hypothetical protein
MQVEKDPMRTSPALVAIDTPVESSRASADAVTRNLMELIETLSSPARSGPASANPSEEVLVDTEVDGSRYLLLRMPSPNRNPNKVIADVLNISAWTVCTHLRRIFAKLGVGSRAAMVAQLLQIGILSNDNRTPAAPR